MALTAVETTLMGLFDRLAFQKGACRYVAVGGTGFWTRTDAAADETFENRCNNANATAADTAISAFNLGNLTGVRGLLTDLQTYCVTDLGLTGLDAYLTARRWRVDAKFAALWVEAAKSALSAANIGGDADAGAAAPGTCLGTLIRGGSISDAADISTSYSASPILGRVTVKGATDWTVTATLKLQDATTKSVAQLVKGTGDGGAVGDTYVFGAQALSGGAASGQKIIPVAATAQFKAAQQVLVTQWSGVAPNEVWLEQEIATIDSISENTSLTVLSNLLHTYTTDAFVYPLYRGVTAASGSSGDASDAISFYPAPDRRLKL
jgi:hypothetical protein